MFVLATLLRTLIREKLGEEVQPVMADIDWSGCLIVERDPDKMGGVATVRAWRVSADSVVENHDDGLPEEEIAEMFGVPVSDVRLIVAYAEQARQLAHIVR